MPSRLSRVAVPVCVALSCLPSLAQTKPKTTVPTESPADAKQIVQMLLRQGKIMRSSEVKRGMRGIGRSVFQGTKIEDFPIEVLGVLERSHSGGDIVLIKVLGGPVVKRQSGIIAGMSGSPVYINGKLLGAIALGWGFPKEPIGGVTPITQMIEGALPDAQRMKDEGGGMKPTQPAKFSSLRPHPSSLIYRPKFPLTLAGRAIERVVVSADRKRLALSGNTMTLRPATTLLQVSGYSEKVLPHLRQALERYQIEPIIGPSSKKTGVNPPFTEGGAIGVQLVSGDMDQTAVGTITLRIGRRVLAFGHPMFGIGAASLPMTTAYIHDIFPSYQRSFKFGSPVAAVGALQQDTSFAIGGTVGMKADMIPMTITLRDDERHIKRAVRVRIMKDPMLSPQLILMTANDAIEGILGQPADKMVRVGVSLEIAGAAPIKRHNYLYASEQIGGAAMVDLSQALSLTQRNEFARGNVKRVDMTVTVEPKRKTARLKQLVANRNKVKPGDTVQISAIFEPSDTPGKTFTRTFDFKVPDDAPSGLMRVAAGPATEFWPLQTRSGGAPPNPTTLPELVTAFRKVGAFNELVIVVSTPRTFLQIDQEKLPSPPPSWSRLVRTSQTTGIGAYNEVEERRELLDFVILGAQLLTIPVENPDQRPAPPVLGTGVVPPVVIPRDPAAPSPRPEETSFGPQLFVPNDNFAMWLSDAPFLRQIEALQRFAAPGEKKDITVPPPPGSGANVPPPVTPPTPAVPTPTPTPKPTPTPTPDAKTLGRPAQAWVQSSPADFMGGTFDHALLTSDGQIRPAPGSKVVTNTPEPFVWSIAGDAKGNVFLGTGNNARVFKVDAEGNRTLLYQGDEVAVSTLTTDAVGNLYAAFAPGGAVYRLAPDGVKTAIFASGQNYVWALEWDAQNRLLVGTGDGSATGSGKVFRIGDAITRTGAAASDAKTIAEGGTLLASVPQKHIRALSAAPDGAIFAGTGDDGVLLRIDAQDGTFRAIFEAPAVVGVVAESEVLAVAATQSGVYFGTSGNGTVYRWTPENGVEALYPSPQQSVFALRRTPDGSIIAATGNKGVVYLLLPAPSANETIAARVLEPDQLQALALAVSPLGDLLVGTGNNGAAYRISLRDKATGLFTSGVFDAKNIVHWGALRYTGRGVTLETRSGNTAQPDKTWNNWQSALTNELGDWRVASLDARYLQYRVRFNPRDPAAGLVRVEAVYRAKNNAPTVTLTDPGGEYWKGKKKLMWSGKDSDGDTLRYQVFISSTDGRAWRALEMPKDDATSYELDTTKWTDGAYRVRVVATDAARNPEDPKADESVSLPFTVDNTPPKAEAGVRVVNGVLTLAGIAEDTLSPIAGAEWRFVSDEKTEAKADDKKEALPALPDLKVGAKDSTDKKDEWHAAAPADGIFDSRRESFVAQLPPRDAKITTPRKIEIRAQDAAGNSVMVQVALPE